MSLDNLLNKAKAESAAAKATEAATAAEVPVSKVQAALTKAGETFGLFKEYDSQLPLPSIEGSRTVKCLYQKITSGARKGEKNGENSYVRIPDHITEEAVTARIEELAPYLVHYLQGVEDTAIKAMHVGGAKTVDCKALTLDSLLEILEEKAVGARLNKEQIGDWFDEMLTDELSTLFLDKLEIDVTAATEQDLVKVEAVLLAYKAKFESLANPKAMIKEADCKAMLKVVTGIEDAAESKLGRKFIAKLTKMMEAEDTLLLAL